MKKEKIDHFVLGDGTKPLLSTIGGTGGFNAIASDQSKLEKKSSSNTEKCTLNIKSKDLVY